MYGKIFESLFTGSMVGSGSHIFAVWSYVIANTKPDSSVELNPRLLAFILGETPERIREAIDFLMAPDSESRSKIHEGRRLIKAGEFQYTVPTYLHYRNLRTDEDRRLYFREKKREQRAKNPPVKNVQNVQEKSNLSPKHKQEAEAEANNTPTVPKGTADAADVMEIYQAYPRKESKPAALKAILKALKKSSKEEILAGIARWIPHWKTREPHYTPHPATWFNQEKWNDSPPAVGGSSGNGNSSQAPYRPNGILYPMVDYSMIPEKPAQAKPVEEQKPDINDLF